MHDLISFSLLGIKTIPTAYSPKLGVEILDIDNCSTKKSCGRESIIPPPSPVSGSAPHAPLCAKLVRIVNPCSIILFDASPCMSATIPTPQASCSNDG